MHRDCGWPSLYAAVFPSALLRLWRRRFRQHFAPHPPGRGAVVRGQAFPNADRSGGAADVGSAAIASHSRLAVQAQPPAASAAGQPDRQAVTRDRSAQHDDNDARRRVATNDSSVITLSFASTCQFGPQIARRRPPFAPFERRPTRISPLVSLMNHWSRWSRFWIRDILSMDDPSG